MRSFKIHNKNNVTLIFFFQKEDEKSQTKEDPNGSSSDQFTQFSLALARLTRR